MTDVTFTKREAEMLKQDWFPKTLEELVVIAGLNNARIAKAALEGTKYCITCGGNTAGKTITSAFIKRELSKQ